MIKPYRNLTVLNAVMCGATTVMCGAATVLKPYGNHSVMSGFVRFSISGFIRLPLASNSIRRYSSFALSKISRLALVGYDSKGVQSAYRAFFVRNISMHSHVMAKLWRDAFERAGNLLSLSTNLSQLCHPYLVVIGKAPKSKGAHTHA